MIDPLFALLNCLKADGNVVSRVGDRIYAGMVTPPPTYELSHGPAVCFTLRGGSPHYVGVIGTASFQVKTYGSTSMESFELARVVFDCLQDSHYGSFRSVYCSGLPVPLSEPDSGWPFSLSFYEAAFSLSN